MTTILFFFWDGLGAPVAATVNSPPLFVAGQVYIPGMQQGQVYVPGMQAGQVVRGT